MQTFIRKRTAPPDTLVLYSLDLTEKEDLGGGYENLGEKIWGIQAFFRDKKD